MWPGLPVLSWELSNQPNNRTDRPSGNTLKKEMLPLGSDISGVRYKRGQRVQGSFTNKWPRSSHYLSLFSDSLLMAHSLHPIWASLQLSEEGRISPSSVHWFSDVICRCGPEMDHHHRTAPRSSPGRSGERSASGHCLWSTTLYGTRRGRVKGIYILMGNGKWLRSWVGQWDSNPAPCLFL